MSALLGPVAALAMLWVIHRRGALALSQAALGNAAVLLTLVLLSRAAHVNYYWWAGSFLALGILTAAAESIASPLAGGSPAVQGTGGSR